MQSTENDKTVFRALHSCLENADGAGVSHIPIVTTTAIVLFGFKV